MGNISISLTVNSHLFGYECISTESAVTSHPVILWQFIYTRIIGSIQMLLIIGKYLMRCWNLHTVLAITMKCVVWRFSDARSTLLGITFINHQAYILLAIFVVNIHQLNISYRMQVVYVGSRENASFHPQSHYLMRTDSMWWTIFQPVLVMSFLANAC